MALLKVTFRIDIPGGELSRDYFTAFLPFLTETSPPYLSEVDRSRFFRCVRRVKSGRFEINIILCFISSVASKSVVANTASEAAGSESNRQTRRDSDSTASIDSVDIVTASFTISRSILQWTASLGQTVCRENSCGNGVNKSSTPANASARGYNKIAVRKERVS